MEKDYHKWIEYAEDAYLEKRLNDALHYYFKALSLNENENLLIEIALVYDELMDYEQAKQYYLRALEYDVENERAYYGLGTIYDRLNKYDEAIAYYEEAIRIQPNYYYAHFFLANCFDELKEYELAIKHYKRVIELKQDHFYAHLNLGGLYENINEDLLALQYLERALYINEENHLLHFNFGVVYRKLGHIEKSRECYHRSLEISDGLASTYLNLAILYKDDFNDYQKALDVYGEGINRHSSDAVLYYNRGCLYALLKQVDAAIADLSIAVILDSNLKAYMFNDEELNDLRKNPRFRNSFPDYMNNA